MKREYKIAHFPRENEWSIFRKCEDMVQWLDSRTIWVSSKKLAKRFLHEQDAVWALIFIRSKQWELKTEEEYEAELEEKIAESKEKTSWSEFSS